MEQINEVLAVAGREQGANMEFHTGHMRDERGSVMADLLVA